MKKTLWISALLLLVLVLAVSCGEKPSGGGDETTPELCVFMTNGVSDYTVLYPLSASHDSLLSAAIDSLKALTEENAGDPFVFKSDFVVDESDMSVYNGAKEILIGNTNRLESEAVTATLRENDYVICIKDGKLLIAGGSSEATAKAIHRFGAMFFSQTQTDLILEETFRYEHKDSYAVESLTIDGVSVSEFVISYTDGFEQEAENLAKELLAVTGYSLTLEKDSSALHTISFAESEQAGAFAGIESGKLLLSGDSALNRSLAISRFIASLSASEVALDSTYSISGTVDRTNAIKLLDLNVYSTGYAENSVNNRYPRLMKLIEIYQPTILCLQEVSPTWLTNMTQGSEDVPALTDSFAYVGTGRNDDSASAMNAIFYNTSLYTLKDSGTFWLSETPDWVSVGWDGRTRCVCTWAILCENASGKEFVVMNTLLDPYGRNARLGGANLIRTRAEAFGLPVILAGDLKVNASNSLYSMFHGEGYFNTEVVASTKGETGKTINGAFGTIISNQARASDFVFVSYGDFAVDYYGLIKDLVDDEYVSNHWPIFTELYLVN